MNDIMSTRFGLKLTKVLCIAPNYIDAIGKTPTEAFLQV